MEKIAVETGSVMAPLPPARVAVWARLIWAERGNASFDPLKWLQNRIGNFFELQLLRRYNYEWLNEYIRFVSHKGGDDEALTSNQQLIGSASVCKSLVKKRKKMLVSN